MMFISVYILCLLIVFCFELRSSLAQLIEQMGC